MKTQKGFRNFSRMIIGAASVCSTVACTQANRTIASQQPTDDIFSNRQIGTMQDVFMINLSEPPIMKVAKKQNGKWIIPAEAKAKLLKEQAAFEVKLKAMAPEAQIIYRYRMTLNALAIYTSSDVASQLQTIEGVGTVGKAHEFARPMENAKPLNTINVGAVTSVNFIGTDAVHARGFTGQGMRVGIIDTGIDYTHSMLGGSGKPEDYAAINPALPNAAFPNAKVIGGIDLVGTEFNAAAPELAAHVPHPDANPLDEAGHGSHVAGTVAGKGDGIKTYDGVAPDAKLYAIKVFGKEGSTADAAVIAGFEYAADPDGDLDPTDRLDVVNLSLGGGFGQPQTLYTAAVKNLSAAGTIVVTSAGNSGPVDYIVGAPSTSDDAISVAASIDGADVNWQFRAVQFTDSTGGAPMVVKALEGPISKPIADSGSVSGELVDIGLANVDLSVDLKAKLAGKVALIKRGTNPFGDKLKRALDSGAIGAVVFNSDATKPNPMGGAGQIAIPAIMVSQEVGLQLLKNMAAGPVSIQFNTPLKILEPANIDTITDFSSKGPRSEDNLIKPEIAAPGQNVTSAAMGKGTAGVLMDGTSMAAPHLTGVAALVRQAHPDLSPAEIKSLMMNTSKVLVVANGAASTALPITLQGAGRVQVDDAVGATVLAETPSLSLGRVQLTGTQKVSKKIVLRNISDVDVTFNTETQASPGMTISVPSTVSIPAGGKVELNANFSLSLVNGQAATFELDGRVMFKQGGKIALQIPAMAIRTQASLVQASASPTGAITFNNTSANPGLALAFNLLGQEAPKPMPGPTEAWKNRECDLQSVGYRIIRRNGAGGTEDVIQFAFKLQQPVTTWITCSVSVLIDSKHTGIADQEIAGVSGGGLEGVEKALFTTVLLDAAKARALRFAYEQDENAGNAGKVNYTTAIVASAPMAPFSQSTLAVIEAPLAKLNLDSKGQLNIKVATQAEGGETFQADKFIGGGLGTWLSVSPKMDAQAYFGMDEVTGVAPSGASISLSKGSGAQSLVLYYPLNDYRIDGNDGQLQVVGN